MITHVTGQHLVENIRDVATMVAESRSIATTLLQELEENSTDANDDTVVVLHFDRSSVYQLVTLLSQLALVASRRQPS
jgi:hypothetical protein